MAKRAVVVEDVEIVARALSTILNLEGFDEVKVVTDSRQALPEIQRIDPDIVVLDIRMPHVTGVELIAAIGARPRGRPGLFVYTATPQDEVDAQLRKVGFSYDAFLAKPAALADMKAAVRAALAASAG